jgi:broad specificity phosphatase PhoE
MTEAQAAWLRKLRDEGPQDIDVLFAAHSQATGCLAAEWSDWSGDPSDPESITPAGLAALAEHERALKAKGDA